MMNEPQPSRSASGGVDPLARYDVSAAELSQIMQAERDEPVFLVWRDDRLELQIDSLMEDERARTIGRRAGVDVRLAWDGRVSSVHARLEGTVGEWFVVDDGFSRNGTYVNEQRVTGRERLADHDRIRVGATVIVFRQPTAQPVIPTEVDGAPRPSVRPTPGQQRVLVALCVPLLADPPQRLPATNRQIADEVQLTVEAVKMHLNALYAKFELGHLRQHDKRVRLAERAVETGLVTRRDVGG